MRSLAQAGAVMAFLSVAFGAFGAHALRERITPDMLATFQTGVQYQAMHALAILMIGLAAKPGKAPRAAGWLMFNGTLFFSGSLYLLALTGLRWLGAITPIGGVFFLAGWVTLAWSLAPAKVS
jgi:uncharacterized membrane protein YgdD (TMEM256/DUF423 family)